MDEKFRSNKSMPQPRVSHAIASCSCIQFFFLLSHFLFFVFQAIVLRDRFSSYHDICKILGCSETAQIETKLVWIKKIEETEMREKTVWIAWSIRDERFKKSLDFSDICIEWSWNEIWHARILHYGMRIGYARIFHIVHRHRRSTLNRSDSKLDKSTHTSKKLLFH